MSQENDQPKQPESPSNERSKFNPKNRGKLGQWSLEGHLEWLRKPRHPSLPQREDGDRENAAEIAKFEKQYMETYGHPAPSAKNDGTTR